MGFLEKLKIAFGKIKKKIIVYLVVVITVAIIGVSPINISMQEAKAASEAGEEYSAVLFSQIFTNIQKPFSCFKESMADYFVEYLGILKYYLLICGVYILVGLSKAIPKHEYQDIENGSSDWCENGEQYTILNKKKGIILAEKNYLPTDKRGNVNVLVVRRFWCW